LGVSFLGIFSSAFSVFWFYRVFSFLLKNLGTQFVGEFVPVIDEGPFPAGLGSRPFDAEGLPTSKKTIVEKGRLQSYLLDTYSGRKLGMASTGNASRSLGVPPGVAPSNFYLAPGRYSPDEIIRSVKQGFYVTELIGFGGNMVTGDYSRGASGLY